MSKVVKYTFCVLCIVIVMSSLPGMAFVFGRRHKTAIAATQNDGEKPPQQQMTTTAMPPTATTTDKLKTDTPTKNQTSRSKQNLQSATSAPKMFEQKATTSRPPIDQAIPPIQQQHQQHKQQQGQQQQQQGQMEGTETATKPLPCGVECSPKGKRAKSGEDLLEEIKKEGSVISNERKEEDSEDWDPEIENKDNKIGLLPKASPEPFNQPSNYGENAAPQTTFKPWLDQKSEIVPPRQTTEPNMHGTQSPTTMPTTTTMNITTPMPPATTTQTKTTVATSQPTTHPLSDAEQWKAQLEEQAKETKDQTKGAYKVLVKLERYLHSKRKEIKDGSDEEKKEWEREGLPRPRYRPQRSIPTSEALAGIYQEEALTELRQKAQKRNREKAVKKAGDDDSDGGEVEATEDDTSEILGEEEDDEDMKTSKKHHKTSRKSKKKRVHHREKTSDAGDESDLITFNEKGEVLSDRESDENNLETSRPSENDDDGDDENETETDSDRENSENKEEDEDEKESDEDKNEEDEVENEGEDENSDAEKEADEEEKENDEDENDEEDADANPDIEDEVDDMDLSTPKDEQDRNPAVFKEAEREEIASDENGQVVASYDDSEDKKQSHGKKSHKSRTKKKHKGLEESERESEESDSFSVDNTDEPNGPIKVKERLEKLAHRLPTGPDGSVEWREPHLHSNCWYHAMTSQDQSFSPSCNQDGTYSPKQCHRQRCWCVSQDGKPHEKSAKLRFYFNIRALMLRCIQNEL